MIVGAHVGAIEHVRRFGHPLERELADGLAVLEEVNFDQLPTRVVVLTAAEDDRDVVRAMRLGEH